MNGCCKFNNKAKVVDNTKCKIGDKFDKFASNQMI